MSIHGRVKLFESIRDMPYVIDLHDRTRDRSCVTKSRLLQTSLFEQFEIKSERRICYFRWGDTLFPPEVTSLAKSNKSWHEFLEVQIPETGRTERVDATWDPELARAGFHVAEWDGTSATTLAVVPYKILSKDESKLFTDLSDTNGPGIWRLSCPTRLDAAINDWIRTQRSPSARLSH